MPPTPAEPRTATAAADASGDSAEWTLAAQVRALLERLMHGDAESPFPV